MSEERDVVSSSAENGRVSLVFACGASYRDVERPEFSHVDRRGRGRLLVYDSEGCTPPTFPVPPHPAVPAPCLHGCPCRTKAGRRQIRAIRSDGALSPPRMIVTCYADIAHWGSGKGGA